MQEIAFGQLGWKPTDFDLFSYREFNNSYKGLDKLMQQHWAMHRLSAFYTVVMNQDPKKGKIKKPKDLFKLGIDREEKIDSSKYARFKKVDGKN